MTVWFTPGRWLGRGLSHSSVGSRYTTECRANQAPSPDETTPNPQSNQQQCRHEDGDEPSVTDRQQRKWQHWHRGREKVGDEHPERMGKRTCGDRVLVSLLPVDLINLHEGA
jgi:hypothetical protein